MGMIFTQRLTGSCYFWNPTSTSSRGIFQMRINMETHKGTDSINSLISQSLFQTNCIVSSSFYSKVSDLHAELYNSPETALTNPLVAFTLIKRLQSEWLNVVSSNEALENAQGLNLASLQDASGGDKCTHPPASAVITHRPPYPR